MTYSLYRERDHMGDSGQMSMGLIPIRNESNDLVDVKYEHDCPPRVGIALRVGSMHARSYHAQDWWQTTLITEIVEETVDNNEITVKFKTSSNSIYIWRKF